MRINIDFTDLFDIVRRSLSVIGKRSVDDQGNPLFKDITIGTNEREVVNDWLTLGMSNLVTEVSHHVDVEQYNNGIVKTIYTDWWQDDDVSTSLITASGQYWYKPGTKKLYVSSLTYPFAETTPATDTLFVHGEDYYRWEVPEGETDATLVQLTQEEVEALTDEQKAAATALSYYGEDPSEVEVNNPGVYLAYNGSVYISTRTASFNEITPATDTAYVDGAGRHYWWHNDTMERIGTGLGGSVTLDFSMPDNWNSAIEPSFITSMQNYLVSFTLYSWFVITAPKIAEKYATDAAQQLRALIRMAYEKKAPENSQSGYEDVNGTVTQN